VGKRGFKKYVGWLVSLLLLFACCLLLLLFAICYLLLASCFLLFAFAVLSVLAVYIIVYDYRHV